MGTVIGWSWNRNSILCPHCKYKGTFHNRDGILTCRACKKEFVPESMNKYQPYEGFSWRNHNATKILLEKLPKEKEIAPFKGQFN